MGVRITTEMAPELLASVGCAAKEGGLSRNHYINEVLREKLGSTEPHRFPGRPTVKVRPVKEVKNSSELHEKYKRAEQKAVAEVYSRKLVSRSFFEFREKVRAAFEGDETATLWLKESLRTMDDEDDATRKSVAEGK